MRACFLSWALFVLSLAPASGARAQAALRAVGPSGPVTLRLVEERVEITVDRQHASTFVRYAYLNDTASTLEGRFSIRTPENVRVEGFAYYNGEQKIVGEVFERATARAVYERATDARRDPGLLEQVGEGEFAFRVFPIAPGERKLIELRFSTLLPLRSGNVEYRIPISRGDARIEATVEDDRPIRDLVSSTHELALTRENPTRVRAVAERALGEPVELVLRFRIEEPPWQVHARVHRDPGHDPYLLVTLAAPASLAASDAVPKDVTLVLDRSGSMQGEPIEQVRAAAADVIARLAPRDRFNVIAFDSLQQRLFERPEPVTAASRERGRGFVLGLSSGGGTNIGSALAHTLEAQHADARPKVVLLLTDGRSAAQEALEVVRNDGSDVRVFTVGIGSGIDRPLLARIASLKRGRFTYVQSASALESRMTELYAQIAEPVLVGVELEVEGARASGVYPRRIGDLFRNDELRIASRLEPTERDVRIVLRGRFRGRVVEHATRLAIPDRERRPWVAATWARARVDDLLEEIALNGSHEELVDEVIQLAIAYDFVTPYTAFLAVPEHELDGPASDLLEGARARRRAILAANPDASAALQFGMSAGATAPATTTGTTAPTATEPPPGDAAGADEEEEERRRAAEEQYAERAPEMAEAPADYAGCASCSAGDTSGVEALLGLLVAWWLVRRRRAA
jgi:Ca-activated chloride channel family protein